MHPQPQAVLNVFESFEENTQHPQILLDWFEDGINVFLTLESLLSLVGLSLGEEGTLYSGDALSGIREPHFGVW